MMMVMKTPRNDCLEAAERAVESILRAHGEITFAEIEAIPMIHGQSDIESVIGRLKERMPLKIIQRKTATTPVMQWERVVQLG